MKFEITAKTVLFGLLAFLSQPTMANTFEEERDLFCRNPCEFVCRESAHHELEFGRKRADLAQRAGSATLEKLGAILTPGAKKSLTESIAGGIQDQKTARFDFSLSLQEKDVKSFMVGLKAYLAELEKHSPVRAKEGYQIIEKYRQLHIERIQAEPTFSEKERLVMIARVKEAKVLLFDYILGFWEEQGIDWQRDLETSMKLFSDVATSCGPDFLRSNASMRGITFTQEFIDEKNQKGSRDIEVSVLFFCPGATFSSFENTVAHEFGHMYDISFARPASYLKLAQCIATEFSPSREVTWMQAKTEAERKNAFWANFDEYFADLGSAEIKAKSLNDDGIAGKIEGLERIRKDLISYCPEPPGKKHGSGKFRIDSIYGANPNLRRAAGCDRKLPPPVTCTLEGRIPVPK